MIVLRVFLMLLIAANLLFYFWGQGMLGGQSGQGEPERLTHQLEAERLKILSPPATSDTAGQPAPEPDKQAGPAPAAKPAPAKPAKTAEPRASAAPAAPAAKAAPEETLCVALSGFGREQARVVMTKFKNDANGIKASTRSLGDSDTYWVMYPELASRVLAERKAAELRALGVSDLFLMGEDTAHPHAISLGLFKSQEKAEEYLASLRQKGVRQARIQVREAANARHVVELTGGREAVNARVAQLLAAYRGTERAKCGAGQ